MKLLLVLFSALFGLFAQHASAQMSSQMPNSSGQIPASLSITSCPSGSVDISIRNGMSGQLVPDAVEASRGAVTVANKNDTDGDGVDDYQDPSVPYIPNISVPNADPYPAYPTGSDIDLMIVTLHKPVSIVPNEKVYLKKTKSGNGLKVWLYPSKGKEIMFSKTIDGVMAAEFSVQELPITLYVEALDYSAKRDIELALKYNGEEDVVNATAIWVNNTQIWKFREECTPVPDCEGPANPEAGSGVLEGLDNGFLMNAINNTYRSSDGSRYGHGSNRKNNNQDISYGGRILFEYEILPNDLVMSEFFVRFDCTRRRETRSMKPKYTNALEDINADIPGGYEASWPSYANFLHPPDEANDDEQATDEDNTPIKFNEKWRIYAWDRPSISNISEGSKYTFWATKNNFEEFVRVKIDGDFPGSGNGLYGSRTSHKKNWHCVYYTKNGPNDLLEPDNTSISHSYPRRAGPGDGACAVQIFSGASNSVFTAYFIPAENKWQFAQKGVGNVGQPANVVQGSNPRQWILVLPGIVQATITEGASAFGPGSRFEFSIFKTTSEKINRLDSTWFSIDNDF
ncbi:MAG: hypothetical protein ACKVU2_09360 [Saprospiraceae bacterium]